jgi:hypothetical protein
VLALVEEPRQHGRHRHRDGEADGEENRNSERRSKEEHEQHPEFVHAGLAETGAM